MKFIIRDDDLNYFSKPEDIEKWYGGLFKIGVPVSFSTIPYVNVQSDAWTPLINLSEEEKKNKINNFFIGDNLDLVSYIKQNKFFDILLHGYLHTTKNGIFEYKEKNNLLEKTMKGKQELEYIFNQKINVFVPPHDQISNYGITVIEKVNLNIIRSKGFRNFFFKFSYFFGILKMIFHKLRYWNKILPPYPFVLKLNKHKEAYSVRLSSSFNEMRNILLEIRKRKGNFIVVNHMHEPNNFNKEVLYQLIEEGERLGFEFIKASELFNNE